MSDEAVAELQPAPATIPAYRRPGGSVTERLAKLAASIDILERELTNARKMVEDLRGII
jgi:hypothetical protein